MRMSSCSSSSSASSTSFPSSPRNKIRGLRYLYIVEWRRACVCECKASPRQRRHNTHKKNKGRNACAHALSRKRAYIPDGELDLGPGAGGAGQSDHHVGGEDVDVVARGELGAWLVVSVYKESLAVKGLWSISKEEPRHLQSTSGKEEDSVRYTTSLFRHSRHGEGQTCSQMLGKGKVYRTACNTIAFPPYPSWGAWRGGTASG